MASPSPLLVVGLGNPGPKYQANRPIGFMAVDAIAERYGSARFAPASRANLPRAWWAMKTCSS